MTIENIKVDKETIKSINSITEIISKTKNYDEFNILIKKHEKITILAKVLF